jgi:hypothetical protein
MLKTLIAAIASFVLGVAVATHRKDKQIIKIHRAYDRAMDDDRSVTFRNAWNDGYQYCMDRHGLSQN